MNITVIKSAWRRWQSQRPSKTTLRVLRHRATPAALDALTPSWAAAGNICAPRTAPRDPVTIKITSREASKFAFQNYALLSVLESHTHGYSHLSAATLAIVKRALDRCGTVPPRAA